jgi:hypothetical protein
MQLEQRETAATSNLRFDDHGLIRAIEARAKCHDPRRCLQDALKDDQNISLRVPTLPD